VTLDERVQAFTEEIWQWFDRKKRKLPWRDLKVRDPEERAYRVLVSEVMLQQTQVPRVEVIYRRFIREFPTLRALARASNREVLIEWRGLGYNTRALRLRDAAKVIVEKYGGKFPREISELCAIKGIGRYTAAAIRNFAWNLPTPCLDTNIRRVLHMSFVGPPKRDGTWRKDDRFLLELAAQVLRRALTRGTAAEWHSALMDYGSLFLKGASGKSKRKKPEPGRTVHGRFIPNRIFRGRVVEALRNSSKGLTLERIGRHIAPDWDAKHHRVWLREIAERLVQERLLTRVGGRYLLHP